MSSADSRTETTGELPGSKTRTLIAKYGYTWRGYVMAILVFPPAAFLVAWKLPRIPTAARLALIILTGAISVALPLALALLLSLLR
ncbi:hypothetical protein [Streptomyces sp. NPDC058867]|uniref:hypothetical protein n=1 Tax=unclassified Streptomyces TaxID=2593676 RepID=UPI00368ABDA9